jgi:hypothetical protein
MYQSDTVIEHLQCQFGSKLEFRTWREGPWEELGEDFHVATADRRKKLGAFASVTVGMGAVPERGAKNGLELYMLAPTLEERHVELMYVTAHYHLTGTRLAIGDTILWGKPWYPQSQCDHALITHPYVDGPSLEWCNKTRPSVRVLWMIPITWDEREFVIRNGSDALEEVFEGGVNYLDPQRQSMVSAL